MYPFSYEKKASKTYLCHFSPLFLFAFICKWYTRIFRDLVRFFFTAGAFIACVNVYTNAIALQVNFDATHYDCLVPRKCKHIRVEMSIRIYFFLSINFFTDNSRYAVYFIKKQMFCLRLVAFQIHFEI